MKYRCITTSIEGFVQQLAVAYITHGYWFYVAGTIPEGKDPAAVDAKLIERYGIAITKWARCRRKKQGFANMQYLRHERFFVLLATKGRHEFFERERGSFRDVRRVPIKFAGYSIGCRTGRDGQWRVSVRIDRRYQAEIKAGLAEIGTRCGMRAIEYALTELRFERYAPVRQQMLTFWRHVNRVRKQAGFEPVPVSVFPHRRRVVRAFASEASDMACKIIATESLHTL